MANIARQLSAASGEPLGAYVTSRNNLSPVLQAVTWMLLIVVVLTILTQLISSRGNFMQTRKFNLMSTATLVLCIGQSAAVSLQNRYGFGKHISSLSSTQVDHALKAQYASQILYVLAICSAKLSFTLFLRDLSTAKSHQRTTRAILVSIAAWTFASLLVTALRCKLPATWDLANGYCIDVVSFGTFYGVLDILTNAILMGFSIFVISNLHVASMARKVKISCYFALRGLAVAATVVQIAFLRKELRRGDVTFDRWPVVIIDQVVLTVSVIVSAVPVLRPFMTSLESGMIRIDDLRRQERQGQYTHTGYFTGGRSSRSKLRSGSGSEERSARKASVLTIPKQVHELSSLR